MSSPVMPVLSQVSDGHSFYGKFLNNESFSDLTITCGDQRFAAHKVIIGSKSDVLWRMFVEKPLFVELEIVNTVPEALRVMLVYIYTNEICLDDDLVQTLVGVVALSKRYAIHELFAVSLDRLETLLATTDVVLAPKDLISTYDMAVRYELKRVVQLMAEYGLRKRTEIIGSFLNWSPTEEIRKLLEIIGCTQSDVIEMIANQNLLKNGIKDEEFKALVDLEKCSINEIIQLMKTSLFENQCLIEWLESKYNAYKQSMDQLVDKTRLLFNDPNLVS